MQKRLDDLEEKVAGNAELLKKIHAMVEANATILTKFVSKFAGEETQVVGGVSFSTPQPVKKRKRRCGHVSIVKRLCEASRLWCVYIVYIVL